MTYVLSAQGLPGVAKYPVDEWDDHGLPTSTMRGWIKPEYDNCVQ